MIFSKECNCRQQYYRRSRAKNILKKFDIMYEGERWIGGLFSSAIIVLFYFLFRFALGFVDLYPIERLTKSFVSCDDQIRNTLFESTLQIPLSNTDGHRWKIFDMLENQPFTITLDLLNTQADFSSISIQENRRGIKHLILPMTSCAPRTMITVAGTIENGEQTVWNSRIRSFTVVYVR